jgi:cellulose synthase operon protein YhjQ
MGPVPRGLFWIFLDFLMIGEPMMDSKPSQGPQGIGSLYSSANLHDAVYRTFSASRIDVRARFRYRVLREEKESSETAQERTFRTHTETQPQKELAAAVASPDAAPAATSAISTAAPQKIEPPPPAPEKELSFRLRPQWLDPGQGSPGGGIGAGDETLQRAKERVASRWFALKDLFTHSTPAAERPGEQQRERRVPVIAIFSFAGGVGKTSLVATLGRALASHGERVLLADTTPFGLLPFYFGARDLKAGVVRTFAPPNNSSDAPVDVVTLDAEQDRLAEVLLLDGLRHQRILVDVQTASEAVVRSLFPLMPTVLAPLLPEMNSVVSVNAIENVFSNPEGAARENIKPIYLLNQFDASLPLHVDVREILQEQLGDRLLPFVVRRSPAVSEALAEGMTVVDYAPGSSAAEDYIRLADWFRSVAAPAEDYRGVRWSER